MRSLESIEQNVVCISCSCCPYLVSEIHEKKMVYYLQPTPKTLPILMSITSTLPLHPFVFRI